MGKSGGSSGGDEGVTMWNEGVEGVMAARKDRREEEGSSEKVKTRAS